MTLFDCEVCNARSEKIHVATHDFRVGFGRNPQSFPAGTRFCELHLQDGLRADHSFHLMIEAPATVELINEWLAELKDWLKATPLDTPGWYGHSYRYHLVNYSLSKPGHDLEAMKHLLSLTLVETRGIDLNENGRFH